MNLDELIKKKPRHYRRSDFEYEEEILTKLCESGATRKHDLVNKISWPIKKERVDVKISKIMQRGSIREIPCPKCEENICLEKTEFGKDIMKAKDMSEGKNPELVNKILVEHRAQ